MMRPLRHRHARNARYGALVALALTFGVMAPAHAAPLETVISVTASAQVDKSSVKVKERVSGTATMRYKAIVTGFPLPLTAAHINSMPLTFSQPQVDATKHAASSAKKYVRKKDRWLGETQWVAEGDTAFVGELTVIVRGSGKAAAKGKKHFHAGTGEGHAVDANATKLITVK